MVDFHTGGKIPWSTGWALYPDRLGGAIEARKLLKAERATMRAGAAALASADAKSSVASREGGPKSAGAAPAPAVDLSGPLLEKVPAACVGGASPPAPNPPAPNPPAPKPPAPAEAWKSNLQPDFNVRVIERFGPASLVVLRELDESNRFVQKSAESTLM